MAEARFTFRKTTMLFPTPLVSFEIAGAERINVALLEEIALRRKNEPGVVRSNRNGWHSALDFFSRQEPAHAELARAIRNAVRGALVSVAGKGADLKQIRVAMHGWVNVNPPGGYNLPHDHTGAFWSGAYYVRNEKAEDGDDMAGAISFIDARSAPAGSALVQSAFLASTYTEHPAAGVLLLFPGTLKHWVHPNRSGEERVTVAFNVFLTNAAARAGPALPE